MNVEQSASPIAIGKRLRRLRLLAALSANELAKLANIGTTSISVWENGAYSMTDRSMDKVLAALKTKGVICNKDWLLTGAGADPQVFFSDQSQTIIHENDIQFANDDGKALSQSIAILDEEIKLFAHSSEYSIILKIEHDGMMPFINKGDVAGGIWQQAVQLNLINDVICIVEVNGKLDIRNVKTSSHEGLFNISYISYNSTIGMPFSIQDLPLVRAAPLKRLWRL